MKIGDKVRFLNSVGGGIVRKFQGKDIVFVEEEDGFETPVLIRECVVIESNETQVKSASKAVAQTVEIKHTEAEKNKEEEKVVSEISGKDILNVYLVFIPSDIKNLGKCNYETYLVNDSNYFLFLNYMNRDNNAWNSRFRGVIEPNSHLLLEEFGKEDLNSLEKICVQFLAYKEDKKYTLKNAQSIEIRIDGVKFYKLHSFRENDFFEDEALVYPIVVNDIPEKEMLVSATDIQEAMNQKAKMDLPQPKLITVKKDNLPDIIEIDLHINELIDTTVGLDNTAMLNIQLDKFREVMEQNKFRKKQKIVFIHGKGEGVLRNAIIQELKTKYKNCRFQDASFKEYGFGATMVTVF